MQKALHTLATTTITLTLASTAGCGGSASPVAVRVQGTQITARTVSHWISVASAGRIRPSDALASGYLAQRQQALRQLISATWLIGEANERGLAVRDAEVKQSVAAKAGSYAGGSAQFREFLKATGQTIADIELEAKSELAAAKLKSMAMRVGRPVSAAQVLAYYKAHRQEFLVPERRVAQVSNRKTWAAAEKLRHEAEAGGSIISAAERRAHEASVTARDGRGRGAPVEKAIYAAPPYQLAGPMKIGADYFMLRVIAVSPAVQKRLSEVEDQIRTQLRNEKELHALAQFTAAWSRRWTAITDCKPSYVIAQCRQYQGPRLAAYRLSLQ